MLACLTFLSGIHSVQDLYRALTGVRSIYEVDAKALSVEGELQFRIQESRRCFLELLVAAGTEEERLSKVAQAREADAQVSLLTGQATVLTRDGAHFGQFTRAWEDYLETRDDMIALSLQSHVPEALAIERAAGRVAFDRAAEALRQGKRRLEASSQQKVQTAWQTMRRACLEVVALLVVSLLLVVALLAGATGRRRMLRELHAAFGVIHESETRFRNVFESASVGIVVLDCSLRIVSVNRAISEMSGHSSYAVTGWPLARLLPLDEDGDGAAALAELLQGRRSWYRTESRILGKAGETGWIRASASLVGSPEEPAGIVLLCEDILEQKLAREQLGYQATHDSLTGLWNRSHFEAVLAADLLAAPGSVSLLYIDLDGFKLVNDTLGHAVGDELLRAVSNRLRDCATQNDNVARVGGDEFIVLCRREQACSEPSASAPEAQLAAGILRALREPFPIRGQAVTVGASIGISRSPEDGSTAAELIQNADTAMYEAKRSRNEGFFYFDARMREAALRRARVEACLRGAVERGEFKVVFQPLYDIHSGALVRFEALCRWLHPELGQVPPGEFIPIAEETGSIASIGEWVLREACRQARIWQGANAGIGVAVNVSAVQFSNRYFVELVTEYLSAEQLPAYLLELELTETAVLRDRDDAIEKMRRLRAMGIRISLDDFGTGFSSLSSLQYLPVDRLKIDRSFTTTLEDGPASTSMVQSLVAMSRTLGLRVTLEGIETRRQMEIARELGCHEAQGYFLGRPESGEDALRRVLKENSPPPADLLPPLPLTSLPDSSRAVLR